MSISWKKRPMLGCDGYGHGRDGDFAWGEVKVGYWVDRELFIETLDKQLAALREGMLAENDGFWRDMRDEGEMP